MSSLRRTGQWHGFSCRTPPDREEEVEAACSFPRVRMCWPVVDPGGTPREVSVQVLPRPAARVENHLPRRVEPAPREGRRLYTGLPLGPGQGKARHP